ncbi:MAG: IclR family transcriptional regulator [Phyllobacterium sp.]
MLTDAHEDRYIVPGLVRGLQVLRAFTPERPNLTLTELAQILGTTRSAAFRTVYTLAHDGCLLHDERNHTYALGPAVLRLSYGYLATRELVDVAMPAMEKLRDKTGWSAHMGILDGTSVLYVLRIPALQGSASIVHVGSRLPARSTTMGRMLLASLSEEDVIRLYRNDVMATGTQHRLDSILAQWKRDRNRQTITHIGDFQAGIASIAAPLRDMTGMVVAAINLSTQAEPDAIETLNKTVIAELQQTAKRISTLLGWQGQGVDGDGTIPSR